MSTIIGDHIESLNYIDPPPSPGTLARVNELVESEVRKLKAEHAATAAKAARDSNFHSTNGESNSSTAPPTNPSDFDDRMTDIESPSTSTASKEEALAQESSTEALATSHPSASEPNLHPRIPASKPISFSPAILAAHRQLSESGIQIPTPSPKSTVVGSAAAAAAASDWTLGGIDSSRYSNLPTAPSAESLAQLYSTATYLETRRAHLSLLGAASSAGKTVSGAAGAGAGISFGQGSWLLANDVLNKEVERMDKELGEVTARAEAVGKVEAERQGKTYSEMAVLEGEWREGVRRLEGVMEALDQISKVRSK